MRRWKDHVYAATTLYNKDYFCPLHNAIRKYGEESFKIELIEECDNSILNDRECYWITYYNSYNNGYNASLGGDGHLKYNYQELVDYYLSHNNNFTETCIHFRIYDQVLYNALQSMNIDYKNLKNTTPKKKYNKWILLVENNIIFKKITDIDIFLNKKYAHGNIRRCLNGITNTAYGYHWREIDKDGNLDDLGYTFFSQ